MKSYEVVNSPITAPAHTVFYSLDIYLKDKTLGCVIKEFIDTHGPFDIIQFDNLEGLSAEILTLKKIFRAPTLSLTCTITISFAHK